MFSCSRKSGRGRSYDAGMITLRAPSGASEQLAHAVELFNRDLDRILRQLDTKQHNEFWTDLHGFALAETRGEGGGATLISSDRVNAAVREALEIVDEKIETHLAHAGKQDRAEFWQMLHAAAEREAESSKQAKARHGGGGGSANVP
jgi:hypothetical protein